MENNKKLTKLQALEIDLDNLPKPGGSYVAVNVRGSIAYVAIQFPIKDNKFFFIGRLGEDVTTEQGYEAARLAAMNVLGQIEKFVGLHNIEGVNHADIYYRATEEWDEGPHVANGASDLFLEVLGEHGKHTRAIFGVHKLPRGFSVALTVSFTIKEKQHLPYKDFL